MMTRGWICGMIASAAGLAGGGGGWGGAARGAYALYAGDFAAEVVSYQAKGAGAPAGYNLPNDAISGEPFTNPATALGRPTVDTSPDYNIAWYRPDPVPVVPLYPAFRATEIVTVGLGGSLVVKFDHRIQDDPTHPYGKDFTVFGNALFAGEQWTNDDPNGVFVDGACENRRAVVSVSQDGSTWHTFGSPWAASFAPGLGRVYDPANPDTSIGAWNQWWGHATDPTLPLNPAYTAGSFGGTVAQMAQGYGESAGGTSFDIGALGLAWIRYVKIENPLTNTAPYPPSIDAIAAVAGNQWRAAGSASWNAAASWSQGVPGGAGQWANLRGTIGGPATVTLDSDVTLGVLCFEAETADAAAPRRYTVAGPGTLTLAGGNTAVRDEMGSHVITARVVLTGATGFTVMRAIDTLTIGTAMAAGGAALTKDGAGTLELAGLRAGSLAVQGGTVRMLPNGSAAGLSRLGTVAVAAGAQLLLEDNDLIVTGQTLASVRTLVASGRNGGTTPWTGSGITSSLAEGGEGEAGVTALAVLGGQEFLQLHGSGAKFDGETVVASDVLVKYTWNGDANLDGRIDFNDYLALDAGRLFGGGIGWGQGDFDYSGSITAADYALIDVAFRAQSGSLADPLIARHAAAFGAEYQAALALGTSVPEPASLALLATGAAAVLMRRRTRKD